MQPDYSKEVEKYECLFQKGQLIDGVVNPDKYFTSSIKIAWFLKEAYTDQTDGWHIRKYYTGNNIYEDFFKGHARPICIRSFIYATVFSMILWNGMTCITFDRSQKCAM